MVIFLRSTKVKRFSSLNKFFSSKCNFYSRTFSVDVSPSTKPQHDVPYETSLHRDKNKRKTGDDKSLPESADVVVIGGGSVGCSTIYHLAKFNVGKVVMIEKDSLTAGTTWHTAGILWNLREGRAVTQMQMQTKELLSKILPEETGFDAGWLETGALFLTNNKEQLDGLHKKSLIGTEFGAESRMVDVAEISRLHPLLNTDGYIGGLYSPHDGSLDPATLCTSYIKAATKYGAEIFEHCEVNNVKTEENLRGLQKVVAVETSLGTIKTNHVVNCTGVWAPYIAKMVGLKVPQVVYKHAYVVTQGIPGIEKCPHLRDIEKAIYHKRQGDALLFGGYERDPILVEKVEKDFAFGLYDLDWDHFECHINSSIAIVPDVAKVGIRSTVCGPDCMTLNLESFTPDGNPLMGESPQVRGFFYGSAFNSAGMMMGGGAGRQLAHWVAYGAPEFSLRSCDINRFARPAVNDYSWLIESCHEHFITRYNVHHMDLQRLSGRNILKTLLHQQHLENGAFFSCVHGWEIPSYFLPGGKVPVLEYDYYGSYGEKEHEDYVYKEQMDKDCSFTKQDEEIHKLIAKEAKAFTQSVAVIDMSHLSKFQISGPSAEAAVQCLFTSDVASMGSNDCLETIMLSNEGKIVSNVVVRKEKDSSYGFIAPAEMLDFISRHVNQVLQDMEMECMFDDVSDMFAVLNIQGPDSLKLLQDVGVEISDDVDACTCLEFKIDSKDVLVYRTSQPGGLEFQLHCASDDVISIYNILMTSPLNPTRAGIRALKSRELETGHHGLLGKSLIDACPYEAKVMTFCPLEGSRDYIGKKALMQKQGQPMKQQLITFAAISDVPVFDGDVIWRNGEYVGTLEDTTYGYNEEKYFLRGFVRAPKNDVITEEYILSGKFSVGSKPGGTSAKLLG